MACSFAAVLSSVTHSSPTPPLHHQLSRLTHVEQGALCLSLAALTRLTCLLLEDFRSDCWSNLPLGMLQRLQVRISRERFGALCMHARMGQKG